MEKNLSMLVGWVVLCCVCYAHATTFVPQSLETQIKNSKAVIYAQYKGQTWKKNRNGEVVTEASFSLLASAGLDENHYYYNPDNFKVTIPGGRWQGITYHVYGAPRFDEGDEVVLVLDKDSFGYSVKNLSMGKYNVVKEGKEKILVSDLFPNHKSFGKFTFQDLQKSTASKFGGALNFETKKEEVKINKNKNYRKVASGGNEEIPLSEPRGHETSLYVLIFIFLGLGFISALLINKNE